MWTDFTFFSQRPFSHETRTSLKPSLLSQWLPKSLECLKNYKRSDFAADMTSGITVGLVALPLAMAFGISSGVTPQAGIYTAIIAGFLISALGGSKTQIGGPTGAFVVVIAAIIARHGLSGLLMVTMMAGAILVFLGLTGLGNAVKFIPRPVIIGFTNGIAVLIASTQIKDFLGLRVDGKVPSEFIERMRFIAENLNTADYLAFAIALASLAVILLFPRITKRVPGSIVALLGATACVGLLGIPVETIGSKFGGIPRGLPTPHLPALSWDNIQHLFQPAVTIALLAAIESLLCAVVADGMVDDRHDANQELIAQGLANIISPLFGGIAATGAIARTATNVKSGARTPVAGIVHAVTLLLIILVAAPLARFVPLAALSAVLVNVALHMGEWHNFTRLRKWPICDSAVFLSAFALTVAVDLTVAVEIGMVLAAILFIKRSSETTQIMAVDESTETEGSHHSLIGKEVPKGVMIYRMMGAFFFGAVDKLESILKREKQEPEVLILRMRKVVAMDATGLNALEDLYEKLHRKGKYLVLSAPHTNPLMVMEKAGFIERLGRENVCPHIDAALARSRQILGLPPAPSTDPNLVEKQKLEVVRMELATALDRVNHVLNLPASSTQPARPIHKTEAEKINVRVE
jgi:SulP family sulfate permease